LGYGTAFWRATLFLIQWRNSKIDPINSGKQRARLEGADNDLQQKIAYARQFAAETVIGQEDLVYTTETDLEQEAFRTNRRRVAEIVRFLRSDTTTRDSNPPPRSRSASGVRG